jgi:hypothetical protein
MLEHLQMAGDVLVAFPGGIAIARNRTHIVYMSLEPLLPRSYGQMLGCAYTVYSSWLDVARIWAKLVDYLAKRYVPDPSQFIVNSAS